MARKRRGTNPWLIFGVIVVLGVLVFGVANVMGPSEGDEEPATGVTGCPDDGTTTLSITLQNMLNDTGAETFNASYVLEGSDGDYITGSNTDGGSKDLNCGESYTLSILSEDGDEKDNSVIESILRGPDSASISDGKVEFKALGSSMNLRLAGTQHGVLEFRAYDNDEAAFIYDDSDASANDYETDGVTFTSTTDNSTATSVGTGGEINFDIQMRSTRADTDFNDKYVLVLVEAPVSTWDEPTVSFEGSQLSDVKGSLTEHEERAYSSYEYIYKVNADLLDSAKTLNLQMKALSGVDPTSDVEVDFASAGTYLSTDGVTVKEGAAQDDSTTSNVYTVQDVTLDLS